MTGPLRWSVVMARLDPAIGHEQAGSRRVLVVSYESFHRSGMVTVCPITSRLPKYPAEVPIPKGMAGQTVDGTILCHQVRTIDLGRVASLEIHGEVQRLTDARLRADVRSALARHFRLDVAARLDGAA